MTSCEGCGASVDTDDIGQVTLHLSHASLGEASATKQMCSSCGAVVAQIFAEVGKVSQLSAQLDDFIRRHSGEPESPKC